MTRKLYKLALWYIRKLHATDRNYRQEVEKMEWLTYKNCGKAHLIYGLGAEWESVGRYEVIDNAIQRLWEYEALGTVEELKEAREKRMNIGLALDLAWRYGQVDGSHHKMWVIDQMARSLCGNEEEYKKWVSKYTEPLEDDDYYEWDCGIAP